MEILDAHHHLWDTRSLRYTLFDKLPALNRPYTIDEFEPVAARNGVTRLQDLRTHDGSGSRALAHRGPGALH